MEWFGNVWRGEFDYDLFRAFRWVLWVFQAQKLVLSEGLLLGEDRGNDNLCQLVDLEEELDEGLVYRWLVNKR